MFPYFEVLSFRAAKDSPMISILPLNFVLPGSLSFGGPTSSVHHLGSASPICCSFVELFPVGTGILLSVSPDRHSDDGLTRMAIRFSHQCNVDSSLPGMEPTDSTLIRELRQLLPPSPLFCDGTWSTTGSPMDYAKGTVHATAAAAIVATGKHGPVGIRITMNSVRHVPNAFSSELLALTTAGHLRSGWSRCNNVSDCQSAIRTTVLEKTPRPGTLVPFSVLLRSHFRLHPVLKVKAHPERRKAPDQFTPLEAGIYLADMLAGDPTSFESKGGHHTTVDSSILLPALAEGQLFTVVSNDEDMEVIADLRQEAARSRCADYLRRRDAYKVTDRFNPSYYRWTRTTPYLAGDVWTGCSDAIAKRALKVRLIWDKKWLRTRSADTEETRACPLCGPGSPETLRHILLECGAPSILEARINGFRRAADSIQEALAGQLPEAEFLLAYHSLISSHPHGETILTGLLTPSIMHRVDLIPLHQRLSGGRAYRAIVNHSRKFYVPLCLDIHQARSALLTPPGVPAGNVRRRPQGIASHLLPSQLREMTSRDTDYIGLCPPPDETRASSTPLQRQRSRPLGRRRPRGPKSLRAFWPNPAPSDTFGAPPSSSPVPSPTPELPPSDSLPFAPPSRLGVTPPLVDSPSDDSAHLSPQQQQAPCVGATIPRLLPQPNADNPSLTLLPSTDFISTAEAHSAPRVPRATNCPSHSTALPHSDRRSLEGRATRKRSAPATLYACTTDCVTRPTRLDSPAADETLLVGDASSRRPLFPAAGQPALTRQ